MPLLGLPACMDAHTLIQEWEVSPFDGGLEGLTDLQDRRVSGAVEAGTDWVILREGDPVAVFNNLEAAPQPGSIDAFEDATGHLYEAPHPAAATLAAMLALDGDVRGEYFTEDTPLSTVHQTLVEGDFTGYIELSENILSGDYYVVYQDGAEEFLGIVGSTNQLLTEDEAKSRAEGEVGIYTVVAMQPPGVTIPTPTPPPETTAESEQPPDEPETETITETDRDSTGSETAVSPSETVDDPPGTESAVDPSTAPADADIANTDVDSQSESESPPSETAPAEETADVADATPDHESAASKSTDSASEARSEPADTPSPPSETASEPDTTASPTADETDDSASPSDAPSTASAPTTVDDAASTGGDTTTAQTGDSAGAAEDSIEKVTVRSIPSLDPETTGRAGHRQPATDLSTTSAGSTPADTSQGTDETPEIAEPASDSTDAAGAEPSNEAGGRGHADSAPRDESRESEGQAAGDTTSGQSNGSPRVQELESEVASLRDERERLRDRIESLEAAAESGGGAETSRGEQLSPGAALAETSLFIRETTRGAATLEDGHQGEADRDTVAENLRIEYHTQFDESAVSVAGEEFETWLRSSTSYAFVEWLIVDLLFEIRSTASTGAMRNLYDALPAIDRVAFDEPVTGGGEAESRDVTFDIVARDRMGEPLVVASLDDRREPTRSDRMRPLIEDAADVCEAHDSLAGTFAVTSSYFEPDALDVAREAASGSLLGREKYRSYVKLARKNGYHLCLVESREETFHLTVPEL